MDLLHRKIKEVNEELYFLISSNENPYYFIQCFGVIRNTRIYDDVIIYDVQIMDVLETKDYLNEVLQNNQTFKIFRNTKRTKRWYNKKVISNTFINNIDNIKHLFLNNFKKHLFEVPCMMSFDSYEEMNQNVINLNSEFITILNEKIDFLVKRKFL